MCFCAEKGALFFVTVLIAENCWRHDGSRLCFAMNDKRRPHVFVQLLPLSLERLNNFKKEHHSMHYTTHIAEQ